MLTRYYYSYDVSLNEEYNFRPIRFLKIDNPLFGLIREYRYRRGRSLSVHIGRKTLNISGIVKIDFYTIPRTWFQYSSPRNLLYIIIKGICVPIQT